MKYTIYGKQVTRDKAQRYLDSIPCSPYVGREYHDISYLEGEAEKVKKLLNLNTYSFCGLTLINE
jgi:hypothetical protein